MDDANARSPGRRQRRPVRAGQGAGQKQRCVRRFAVQAGEFSRRQPQRQHIAVAGFAQGLVGGGAILDRDAGIRQFHAQTRSGGTAGLTRSDLQYAANAERFAALAQMPGEHIDIQRKSGRKIEAVGLFRVGAG